MLIFIVIYLFSYFKSPYTDEPHLYVFKRRNIRPPTYKGNGRVSQSASMCTKLMGNMPLLDGSDSTAPSIQLSSSVWSFMTMITSPSRNDSSSSLSASQSYKARQRRKPTMPVLLLAGEFIVAVVGTVAATVVGCGCCRGQKKYGCSGVSKWNKTENTQHSTLQLNDKV
ncbi:hypothetical protein C0J52_04105 [Blattella germanica]|nr:hypothetical protein C0J52_04105 [Blattella germanica]